MKELLGRSTTVLIVDDNPTVLEVLKEDIEQEFGKILTAQNGIEALEIMKVHAVEIVVTDYKMPEMNGVELIKKLKQLYPMVPVLMLTGNTEQEPEITQAVGNGAFDVVSKPYNPQLLINRVRNALLLPLLVQVLWSVMSKEWKAPKIDDFMRLEYEEQLKTIYAFAALLKTKGLRIGA